MGRALDGREGQAVGAVVAPAPVAQTKQDIGAEIAVDADSSLNIDRDALDNPYVEPTALTLGHLSFDLALIDCPSVRPEERTDVPRLRHDVCCFDTSASRPSSEGSSA